MRISIKVPLILAKPCCRGILRHLGKARCQAGASVPTVVARFAFETPNVNMPDNDKRRHRKRASALQKRRGFRVLMNQAGKQAE